MDIHTHKIDDPPTLHDVDNPAAVFVVYLVVLLLSLANIGLGIVGLGAISLPVQLAIASVQAFIVAWYWMHLRRKDTVVTLTAVTSLFFVFIFYVLVLADILTRPRGGL
jgi:cytochrome c oxidase subunit IV